MELVKYVAWACRFFFYGSTLLLFTYFDLNFSLWVPLIHCSESFDGSTITISPFESSVCIATLIHWFRWFWWFNSDLFFWIIRISLNCVCCVQTLVTALSCFILYLCVKKDQTVNSNCSPFWQIKIDCLRALIYIGSKDHPQWERFLTAHGEHFTLLWYPKKLLFTDFYLVKRLWMT